MWTAAFFGALAASALLVGALFAYGFHPSPRITAAVMALGSGLLIGSVAYDLSLTPSCRCRSRRSQPLLAGAAVFVLGSRVIERRGGDRRKDPTGAASTSDNPLGIVLGSVFDGIPESFVLGLSVLNGGVSVPLLIGIAMSNLPEGMAASSGLRARGWPALRTMRIWAIVIVTSGVSAAMGHRLLATDDGTITGVVQTFAAGALLAMVADTMVPEAYQVARTWTGGLVVAGFTSSLLIAALLV